MGMMYLFAAVSYTHLTSDNWAHEIPGGYILYGDTNCVLRLFSGQESDVYKRQALMQKVVDGFNFETMQAAEKELLGR